MYPELPAVGHPGIRPGSPKWNVTILWKAGDGEDRPQEDRGLLAAKVLNPLLVEMKSKGRSFNVLF